MISMTTIQLGREMKALGIWKKVSLLWTWRGLGESKRLSTIKTLKRESLIIACESALSKGNKWWEEWWGDGGDGRGGEQQVRDVATHPAEQLSFAPSLQLFHTCKGSVDKAGVGSISECLGSFCVTLHIGGLSRLSPYALKPSSCVFPMQVPAVLSIPASCSPSHI